MPLINPAGFILNPKNKLWPKLTEKSELKSANTKLSFVVGLTNELNMVGLYTDLKKKTKKKKKKKRKRFDRNLASLDLRYCTFFFRAAKKKYQVV